MEKSSEPQYSETVLERVETCGQCQMSLSETALLCGVTTEQLESAELSRLYVRGKLEAELAVRRSLVQKAQDGDSSAQKDFLKLASEIMIE